MSSLVEMVSNRTRKEPRREPWLIRKAREQNIEVRFFDIRVLSARGGRDAHLRCPFCGKFPGLFDGNDLVPCEWCSAYLWVVADLELPHYATYAIAELPQFKDRRKDGEIRTNYTVRVARDCKMGEEPDIKEFTVWAKNCKEAQGIAMGMLGWREKILSIINPKNPTDRLG